MSATGAGRPRYALPARTGDLSFHQVRALLRASEFAEKISLGMNAHATVHFPDAADEQAIPKYIAAAMRAWRQWLKRRGFCGTDTAYMWVREARGSMTSHVHILLHVPPEIRHEVTNRRIARLFPRTAGFSISEIADNAADNSGTPILVKHRDTHQPHWVRYVAKGIRQDVAHRFPQIQDVSPQGTIIGKRYGISENISEGQQYLWSYEERWLGLKEARSRWAERTLMSKSI